MLSVLGSPQRTCDGVSRRGFLQVGALGFGGLCLAQLGALRAQGAVSNDRRTSAVIFIEMAGGPSHMETYDPKPDAPIEFRGPLSAIKTNVSGVYLSEYMAEQAKVMDKLAIIRSMHHKSSSHSTSSHLTQTGYYLRDNQNPTNEMPSAGSVASALRGSNDACMPAYVTLPRLMRYGSSGYLSKAYNPFIVDGDPSRRDFEVRNLALTSGLSDDRLTSRRELLAAFDSTRQVVDNAGLSGAMDEFTTQAFDLITSPKARDAFDLTKENDRTRELYGKNLSGQSLLLARRLVEAGVTFVSVRPTTDSWDDHTGIAKRIESKGPAFDRAVAGLVSDLYDRGLSEQVLVVAIGEFGRTPRVNRNAGRDHWGSAMSALVSGGGLQMGQVIGSTAANGDVPQDRPYRPENLLATVYRHLGIDPSTTFLDHAGRPRYVLETREAIAEL